jgi:hypothetical protein
MRISVLAILSENKTTSKASSAIGNGRTTDKKIAIPR